MNVSIFFGKPTCKPLILVFFLLTALSSQASSQANRYPSSSHVTPPRNSINIQVSEAPMNNLGLTVGAIKSAKQTLLLNIYELTAPEIVDALIERIDAGVHVEILEEGAPVGGLSAAAKGVQAQLIQAMKSHSGDRLFEMRNMQNGVKRRFVFDHGKYAVIDDASLLIGSENYSPSGNPAPGSIGNRGWEVLIQSPALAADYKSTFRNDANPAAGDVIDLTQNQGIIGLEDLEFSPSIRGNEISSPHPTQPVDGYPTLSADSVTKIVSPDSSVTGVVNALNSATQSIDIEQMTFDSAWGTAGASNPVVDAVVAAAKRKVVVRVLLNDEVVFDHPGQPAARKNLATIDALNKIAKQLHLNMEARTANIKAMGVDYIHNKGLLVDGNKTLVSSINWNYNSFNNNREAAVLISSPTINSHYKAIFNNDWQVSANSGTQPPTIDPGTHPGNGAATPSETAPISINCPATLELDVAVGDLTISNSSEEDFKTLSGAHFSGHYTKSNDAGCVYSSSSTGPLLKKSFIEIRTTAKGNFSINFEGYTQKTSKLYSVRARIISDNDIYGAHDALLYNASSASREKLGEAVLSVSSK